MSLIEDQKKICEKYRAGFLESPSDKKVGISLNVKAGEYPIHGLRHPQDEDTTGWYIWSGDYSDDPEFFKPLHVKHLNEWNPLIKNYLGLAPGWRFLITPDYEDVWQDLTLLEV